jgi:hypothetical protein
MGLRVAQVLSGLAVVAWGYGVGRATMAFRANTGRWPDALFLWTIVPLLAATVAFLMARRRRLAPPWIAAGLCVGFVVLSAWSLGRFFAWSALLLLASAMAHAVTTRAGWRAIAVPVWLTLGGTALCPILLTSNYLRDQAAGRELTAAPIVVAGAWVFLGLGAALVLWCAVRGRLSSGGSPTV